MSITDIQFVLRRLDELIRHLEAVENELLKSVEVSDVTLSAFTVARRYFANAIQDLKARRAMLNSVAMRMPRNEVEKVS